MKIAKRLVGFIALLLLAGIISACATVQPEDRIRAEVRDAAVAKTGETVSLFYGMSEKAKEEFCLGAVVPVYRLGKGYVVSKTEVGKIKVTKELSAHYIEGVVVDGAIRTGDIAMQPNSECLIRLPEPAEE